MDVSLISSFREKDERCVSDIFLLIHIFGYMMLFRVFFGCYHDARQGFAKLKKDRIQEEKQIHVSSIRIIQTYINYKKVIQDITAFDSIISNYEDDKVDSYKAKREIEDGWKVDKLLTAALEDNKENDSDVFIKKTVELLLSRNTKIEMNLDQVNRKSRIPSRSWSFVGTIFHGDRVPGTKLEYESYEDTIKHRYTFKDFIPKYDGNLFGFDYFSNLEILRLNEIDNWSFSLHYFLWLLVQSNVKQTKISATNENSWLAKVWEKESGPLQSKYQGMGFNIDFKKYNHRKGTEYVIIDRKKEITSSPRNIKTLQYSDITGHILSVEWETKIHQLFKYN